MRRKTKAKERADGTVAFTIGHSTRPIDEFVSMLNGHGIAKLVDVRTVPRSRTNPQFNKDILPESLEKAGIAYVHVPELGGLRKPKRDSPNGAWRNLSFRGYADHMQTEEFARGLELLFDWMGKERIALMCAEAVPWRCHRSLIADALTVRGIPVLEIGSPATTQEHTLTPFAKAKGTAVTYPAEATPRTPNAFDAGGLSSNLSALFDMAKLTVRDLDLHGKRVLMRVDYNVPMEEKDGQMVINDATRIKETLPTLELLVKQGAKIILIAHLGRPDGKREPSMSLKPVAAKLSDMLGAPVAFQDDCVGERIEKYVNTMKPGDIVLLENLRFYPEEEGNSPAFSEKLARLADVYVNDAFGAAHRAHASTAGVAQVLAKRDAPRAAGLLMERELKFLGEELEKPAQPFVVILGGAKVSDKIKVIDRLLEKANTILIGGAMAYTFKLALGETVGKSLVEADKVDVAKEALAKAKKRGVKFLLPTDNIVATPVKTDKVNKKGKPIFDLQNVQTLKGNFPAEVEGLDIGPETRQCFGQEVLQSKTILWNGPMGLFEDPRFAEGTNAVAKAVVEATKKSAKSIIGGGDSVKALNKAKLGDQVTFMSTGGGASLEFLEGKELPGVAALSNK